MLNSVTMVGRLTRDPELRQTQSGNQVGNFTIACDGFPVNGEKQVVFMNCSIFGKGADTLTKFFKKGNLIGITGRLTQRKYQSKEGAQVTATEITVTQIEFVDSKADREGQNQQGEAVTEPQAKNVEAVEVSEDELPF